MTLLEISVTVRAGTNEIVVALWSRRGTPLTIEILRKDAPVDTTPLSISANPSPAPNANGWNNTPVTVTFTCSGNRRVRATSGRKCDGAGQVVSGTATDVAGNSASASVTLKVDRTAPVVSAVQSPAVANANGWNNGPVTVTCTGVT